MDIYLTAKSSGERLRIPLLPDRVNVKTGSLPVSFQIIKLGEARIPRGTALTGYSWNGTFPGESMSDASFVFDWQEPNRIVALLKEWMTNGETLTLMITETTINDDVFIENFTFEHYGIDNVAYTLNLTQARELYVSTTPPPPVPPVTEAQEETTEEPQTQTGVVTGGSVYYRKGPGKSYKAYGTKHKGDTVTIYGKSGNWYKINEDPEQWMCATYVKVGGGSTSSSSSTKKKSSSSSSKKKTTATSSSSTTTTKKTLTISKPASNLINAAAAAVKKVVTKVSAALSGKK